MSSASRTSSALRASRAACRAAATSAAARSARATIRVVLLAPSTGLGGGIERYVATLEAAFQQYSVPYRRVNLLDGSRARSTPWGKAKFIRGAWRALAESAEPATVVMAHRDLVPTLPILKRNRAYAGATVILHGTDAWTNHRRYRTWMLSRRDLRAVAASSFTAGTLIRTCRASVLPPGLSQEWFTTLATARKVPSERVELLTVFRLTDWKDKGLPQLLAAVRQINRPDVRLTVCGSGRVPDELRDAVRSEERCELVVSPSDAELARRFASAFAFVLATRTRAGSKPSGEGFGMVLLEAQVAGAPVIAPAYAGSFDAYQEGITGLAPIDESAGALAATIERLIDEPGLRDRLARAAGEWARARFAPEAHAARVIELLLPNTSNYFDMR